MNDNLQFENPMDYFTRTRTDETPPAWAKNGCEENDFLNFLIYLAPLFGELAIPEFEPDGCVLWEFRKSGIRPKGIRI